MYEGSTGSRTPVSASGLVRVTVASQSRRVDLALPGVVPVAELLPELARSVGLLDPARAHGGFRLVTQGGRVLAGDSGLVIQGVEEGALLTVTAGVDDAPPRVYDDVVEAMNDVVERDLKPWPPAAGRRTALTAAALLMAIGAVALSLLASPGAGVAAASVCLVLTAGAIVISRVQRETEAPVAMAWLGAFYAAVAGSVLARDELLTGLPVAYAGAGAMVASVICLVGLGKGRTLVIPPVVGGAISLATGLVIRAAPFDPAVVLTAVLTLVVMVGSVFPWLALGATGTAVDQLSSIQDITANPGEVDPDRVCADARIAHQILVAMAATLGLLLMVVGPLAVSLGVSGTLLAVGCCLVVMLRTRHHRAGSEVLVGMVSGIAGLLSVAIALLWFHPAWRPVAAGTLAGTGGLVLAVTLLPLTRSARWERSGDLAETAALLALLPLLVVATGIYAAIRD
jgi:type VII secretion integral membrane protein EccD